MSRYGFLTKIKASFARLKARFSKDQHVPQEVIDKEAKTLNDDIIDTIENISEELKREREKNRVLERNLLHQPTVQRQIFEEKMKEKPKKIHFIDRVKGKKQYTLHCVYSWYVRYTVGRESPMEEGENNVVIDYDFSAKNNDSALTVAESMLDEIGKVPKRKIANILSGPGVRRIEMFIDNSSNTVYSHKEQRTIWEFKNYFTERRTGGTG